MTASQYAYTTAVFISLIIGENVVISAKQFNR